MTRTLHEDARAVLQAWQPDEPDQSELREEYLAHLADHPDGMWRSCQPGHLTASVILFDESLEHVLLTLHPKHQRWLQLGGHCEESDATLAAAALREAVEEGGIPGIALLPEPVRLDRHPSRCYPPPGSWHLDVQYAATAPNGARPVISDESMDLRWWAVDALPGGVDAIVGRLVQVGRDRLADARG